jgi:hypothetical protein
MRKGVPPLGDIGKLYKWPGRISRTGRAGCCVSESLTYPSRYRDFVKPNFPCQDLTPRMVLAFG